MLYLNLRVSSIIQIIPNEVADNIISSLENDKTEFQIDDYFSKYADTFSEDDKNNKIKT